MYSVAEEKNALELRLFVGDIVSDADLPPSVDLSLGAVNERPQTVYSLQCTFRATTASMIRQAQPFLRRNSCPRSRWERGHDGQIDKT